MWSKSVVNYKDWQISLSRRFKAIRLWLIMRSHGVAGLRDHIQRHMLDCLPSINKCTGLSSSSSPHPCNPSRL
ncbi:hypothetical protein SAY87_021968 [Trapa incisa]|uniref:Uncharacterized protein n=1 Tax=Trapa incisa TaxID=236973 RepID=A0AAN7PX42_9MYRT|nr:hypothetical protein SAY87_021968 [Trapa incisa]